VVKCFFTILFTFFLLIPSACFGEKYWVDPISPNRSIPCDFALPCKNVDDFINKLLPGDEVIFKMGTYRPLIIANIKGSIENPITFKSESGKAIFEHAIDSKGRDLLEFRNVENVVLTGFTFNRATRASIRINNSIGVEISNNHLNDSGLWGILTNHTNNVKILNNEIKGTSRQHGIYISNSGDNVLIKKNFIENALGSGIHINGDLSMGGGKFTPGDGIISNVKIIENIIINVGVRGGAGINLDGAENVEIKNNILWKLHSAGITIFKDDGAISSRNINIENNLIYLLEGSRWGLIINNSSGPVFFYENIVLSANRKRGAFEFTIENKVERGIFNKLKGKLFGQDLPLPLISYKNVFALEGNIASINDEFTFSLADWNTLSEGADVDSISVKFQQLYSKAEKVFEFRATKGLPEFYQYIKSGQSH